MKKNLLIITLFLVGFIQLNFGQDSIPVFFDPTGIIWVVPKRADAFPVNGNWTGNSGLNLAFEDYHVIEYVFIDSLYFTDDIDTNLVPRKQAVYQIRLQEEYKHWEFSLLNLLHYCYPGYFSDFAYPYYNRFSNGQTITTDNGRIVLEFENILFDPSLFPRSSTRSYNKPMNLILKKYDIKSYKYIAFPPANGQDTTLRYIEIISQFQDALPLYYDLLNIHYLYDRISIARSFIFGESDFSNPCGPYSGISIEEVKSIQVFPNPAQDEISITGVIPESVIVYDVMGKMVVTEFNAEKNKIDIKHLPDGLYILKIMSKDGKAYSDKILKQ